MAGEEPSDDGEPDEEVSDGEVSPSADVPDESAPDGPDDADTSGDADPAADDPEMDESSPLEDGAIGEADEDPAQSGEDDEGEADDSEVEHDATTAGAEQVTDEESEPLFGGLEGPEEDREMPLAAHIEEMLRRLAIVVAVAGLVSLLVFPFADRVVNFLWYSVMPGVPSEIARPRLYGVLEKLFTEVKVASLAGLIVALPVLVFETYAFMRPGLYPNERRYYLAAVPTSLVLAIVGVSFAYFVILPAIFVYFLYYSQDVATIGFALGRTFDLVLLLMGYMAIVFQIPLFIMLAMMMGLVTRRWLAARRLLFWGGFLGLSFLFSPDPTGMAPIIVAATMIVLFEGTLLLTKWTGRE